MHVEIPAEFKRFAREQIAAGHASSVQEAAILALQGYAKDVEVLRALVDPALADLDRGDVIDGEAFMDELLAETRALVKAAGHEE